MVLVVGGPVYDNGLWSRSLLERYLERESIENLK